MPEHSSENYLDIRWIKIWVQLKQLLIGELAFWFLLSWLFLSAFFIGTASLHSLLYNHYLNLKGLLIRIYQDLSLIENHRF